MVFHRRVFTDVALSLCLLHCFATAAAEPVLDFDLALKALVYDPLTEKLYGASGSDILQIDPDSGEVLRAIDMGDRVLRMELGAGGGIWTGMTNAVRRLNLQTLAAEEPIAIPGEVFDLSPSQSDPYTLALSIPRIPFRWESARIIRNGVLLPDSTQNNYVALHGNYLFADTVRFPIGPNGVVSQGGFTYLPVYYAGRMKSFENYIYHENGTFFDAETLQAPERNPHVFLPFNAQSTLAISPEQNSVFYLSDTESNWVLNRFEHKTFTHTGHYTFPRFDPEPIMASRYLAVWSTNRAAFHSATKLYLLDTAQLFLPADLEVSQTLEPRVELGETVRIHLSITNRGPGAALNVAYTNLLFSEVVHSSRADRFAPPAVMQPGTAYEFTIEALASDLGSWTNRLSVAASNDPEMGNNLSEMALSVVRDADRVVELDLVATDIDYDPVRGRLFIADQSGVWYFEMESGHIGLGVTGAVSKIEVPDGGGWLFAHASAIRYYDSELLTANPVGTALVPAFDLAASAMDLETLVISDVTGTYVLSGGAKLPGWVERQGYVEFSADGTKVYFADAANCAFSIFSLGPNGLTLDSTQEGVSCSDFTVSEGLIYFNDGLIYDPATGQESLRFNLTPPVFLVPRTNGTVDVLNRTNGVWLVRRFVEATREVQSTVPLGSVAGTPLEMVGAGPETVAIRTSPVQVLVVDLADHGTVQASIRSGGGGEIIISFYTHAGANYRIQSTDRLDNPNWVTVRDNIPGTGGLVEVTIPPTGSGALFYRIVRL